MLIAQQHIERLDRQGTFEMHWQKTVMVEIYDNLCLMLISPINCLLKFVQEKFTDYLPKIFTFYPVVLMVSGENFQGFLISTQWFIRSLSDCP